MNKVIILAGVAILGLGLLLHLVGLATTGWLVADGAEWGLFKVCDHRGNCVKMPSQVLDSDIEATRAMVIIGLLLGGLGGLLAVVHLILVLMSKEGKKIIPIAAALACFAAMGAIMIGVIIYGASYYPDKEPLGYDLGYSFALCIVGAILIAGGGAVVFLGSR